MRTRAAVVMALYGACTIDERSVQLPEEPTQHSATSFDIPVGSQFGYDILVVVDNSSAMAPHADRVIPQLGKLFTELARFGDPDWHLAVISSDLGGPGCSEHGDNALFRTDGLVGAPFLIEWRHLDGRLTSNHEGELGDAVAKLATVGTTGCVRQQPLAAVRRALEQPRNAGFRRDDAKLVVVIVSAADDASPGPIIEHVESLRDLAPDHRLSFAGIYDGPAPRLDTVIAAFPIDSKVAPLSSDDLVASLHLRMFSGGHWGVPCIEGKLGPTPECSISDVLIGHGSDGELRFDSNEVLHEALIPQCDAARSVKPCWKLEVDLQNCTAWYVDHDSLVLEIERHDYPPLGTHVRGTCVTL